MGFRVIYVDSTAGTAVNASTSATVPIVGKNYQLSASDDEWIAVTATFQLNVNTAVAGLNIPLQIVVGPNTYSNTILAPNAVGTYLYTLVFPVVSRAGDTVQLQTGVATGTVADSTVNVVGFYIQAWSGISGGT